MGRGQSSGSCSCCSEGLAPRAARAMLASLLRSPLMPARRPLHCKASVSSSRIHTQQHQQHALPSAAMSGG